MDWANERYVRLYTRDTLTWKLIGWEGRAVLPQILRKVDRSGVLELGGLDPADAVAAVIDAPIEMVRVAVGRLVERGAIEVSDVLVVPQFVEAQETSQSNAQRNREWRARRRDEARSARRNVTPCGDETSQERDVARRRVTPSLPSPPSSSESYDSGGKPPNGDITKKLFDALVPILTAAGSKPSSARSLVGRLRNHHGDEKALALVPAASRMTDPAGWLAATLKNPAELPYCPAGRKT